MWCSQGKRFETMASNRTKNDWTMNPISKNQLLKPLQLCTAVCPLHDAVWLSKHCIILYKKKKKNLPSLKIKKTWKWIKPFDGIKMFKFHFSLAYTATKNPPTLPPPIFCGVFSSFVCPPLFISHLRLKMDKNRCWRVLKRSLFITHWAARDSRGGEQWEGNLLCFF